MPVKSITAIPSFNDVLLGSVLEDIITDLFSGFKNILSIPVIIEIIISAKNINSLLLFSFFVLLSLLMIFSSLLSSL